MARAGWSICTFPDTEMKPAVTDPLSSYGMILAREKNDELALYWLVRSVHLFPMNWGCWLEMSSLITRVDDVSCQLMPLSSELVLTGIVEPSHVSSPTKYRVLHVSYIHLS